MLDCSPLGMLEAHCGLPDVRILLVFLHEVCEPGHRSGSRQS